MHYHQHDLGLCRITMQKIYNTDCETTVICYLSVVMASCSNTHPEIQLCISPA